MALAFSSFTCPVYTFRIQLRSSKSNYHGPSVGPRCRRLVAGWRAGASAQSAEEDLSDDQSGGNNGSRNRRRTTKPRTKKVGAAEQSTSTAKSFVNGEKDVNSESPEAVKQVVKRNRRKAVALSSEEADIEVKPTGQRRSRRRLHEAPDSNDIGDTSSIEEPMSIVLDEEPTSVIPDDNDNGNEPEVLYEDDGEDISFTYGSPPLVCCFGAAKYAFLPSGRAAIRLVDREIHESRKELIWSPDKFVRAPGGPSSSVALALASLGGRVAFMGKLGDDKYGQSIIYHLNTCGVQTRAIKLDRSSSTAVSYMKMTKRGRLKMSCAKPCAEDRFQSSDINLDVLKEAKMLYFNSSALLEKSTRSALMQAVRISKKLGATVFFDVNLPIPLWNSREDTKSLIMEAWEAANIVEVTNQELEFIGGIEPTENYDMADSEIPKFTHLSPDEIMHLWHDDMKVMFVTNGTSVIHYYTAEHDGAILGMEDPPITPLTCDMSAAGDAVVAALMKKLTIQPHLITDKQYLKHIMSYAMNAGIVDQWSLARIHSPPPGKRSGIPNTEDQYEPESFSETEYHTMSELVS